MPKYPEIPNRYPTMTHARKGIPIWREELQKHPIVYNSGERYSEFGSAFKSQIDYRFNPFPVIYMKNPYSEDDKCPQNVFYQWSVLGSNETWQHYGDVVDFSDNPYCNPTIETNINNGYAWFSIFPIFHVDWRIQIYKIDSNLNVQTLADYRYDDCDRNVYIYIEPRNSKQRSIWLESCLEYKEKTQCNLYINDGTSTGKQKDFTFVKSPNEIDDIYASYYIGYGDHDLFGYSLFGEFGFFDPHNKYLGKERIGFNPFGGAIVYSAANPRDPNVLSDKQISEDVLGLSDWNVIDGC